MLTGKAVRECVVDAAIISTLDVCSRMAFLIVLSVPSLISLMFPRLSGVGFHAGRVSSHVINDSLLVASSLVNPTKKHDVYDWEDDSKNE